MKKILVMLVFVIANTVSGQEPKQIDSLSFCNIKYKIPAGCKAESEYQLDCDTFSIQWLYMNDAMLKTMPEHLVGQLEEQMREFKKEPIIPYLLGNKVTGYKVSYKVHNVLLYQLIAYGVVKGQPVMVQFTLNKDPKTNAVIPEFVRQIIRVTK